MSKHYQPAHKHYDSQDKEHHTHIHRQTEAIDRKGVDSSTQSHGVRYDNAIYSTQDKHRHNKRNSHLDNIVLYCAQLVATEEVYHHKRRDSEQVEDMDTYRETHKVGDKDYPAH